MRNPLNEILTPGEQKALLFLAICFMLGTALNLLGWKPTAALMATKNVTEVPPESLATALQEDVPIIIDIRTASLQELVQLPGIGENALRISLLTGKQVPLRTSTRSC